MRSWALPHPKTERFVGLINWCAKLRIQRLAMAYLYRWALSIGKNILKIVKIRLTMNEMKDSLVVMMMINRWKNIETDLIDSKLRSSVVSHTKAKSYKYFARKTENLSLLRRHWKKYILSSFFTFFFSLREFSWCMFERHIETAHHVLRSVREILTNTIVFYFISCFSMKDRCLLIWKWFSGRKNIFSLGIIDYGQCRYRELVSCSRTVFER